MVYGLDVNFETKDYSYGTDGKLSFLSGKERSVRNYEKLLRTTAGPEEQIDDTDARYNPLFGSYMDTYIGQPSRKIGESITKTKLELERINKRFISNQEAVLGYMEESEYFARFSSQVASYKEIGIEFLVDIYTAEDIRLSKTPSVTKQFINK